MCVFPLVEVAHRDLWECGKEGFITVDGEPVCPVHLISNMWQLVFAKVPV